MWNALNGEEIALYEENRKMGKEYGNFGHFPQIDGNLFLDQRLFSSPPLLQKANSSVITQPNKPISGSDWNWKKLKIKTTGNRR